MYHLAQVNLAHLKAPIESELLAGFVAKLDEINALADASPGFVWRFLMDSRDPAQRVLDDPMVIFNMSVWADLASLHHYVYKTAHAKVFAQRQQWFHDWAGHLASSHMALWWVKAGQIPKPADALERVAYLLAHGASSHAFTFKRAFDTAGKAIES